jgi:hypothetical protein
MFVVGIQNQQAGHGQCGLRLPSPFLNHLTGLSSDGALGFVDPTASYPYCCYGASPYGRCSPVTRRFYE